MALFGFGKDDREDGNPAAENRNDEKQGAQARRMKEQQWENLEDGAAVLNDGRRFFFVAEEVSPVRGGTVVTGIVHGKVDLGDQVYVLQPNKHIFRAVIGGMETRIESYMMKIQTATDMAVNIFLSVNPADVRRFAVFTSVKPQLKPEESGLVENPLVAALMYEKRLFSDEGYFDWLCLALTRGCFITAVQTDKTPEEQQDGPILLEKDGMVGFCMLPDPKHKGGRLLPVFTDADEMGKWESVAKEERARTVLLRLPDIVAVADRFQCSGFVVNPYSANQCIISRTVLAAIVESDGYKRIFSA